MRKRIDFHIEKLVLWGFDRADRYRIGAAVQSELSRLLTELGMPSLLDHGSELVRLDGESFKVVPESTPEVIGVKIARAVFGGLTR